MTTFSAVNTEQNDRVSKYNGQQRALELWVKLTNCLTKHTFLIAVYPYQACNEFFRCKASYIADTVLFSDMAISWADNLEDVAQVKEGYTRQNFS